MGKTIKNHINGSKAGTVEPKKLPANLKSKLIKKQEEKMKNTPSPLKKSEKAQKVNHEVKSSKNSHKHLDQWDYFSFDKKYKKL